MTEALSFHMKESDLIHKQFVELQTYNRQLKHENELNEKIMHTKIEESKKQREEIVKVCLMTVCKAECI